jgi:hypothetical protein
LTTGIREGELIGLQVRGLRRTNGTLAIRRTVYNGVEGSPKSKSGRRTIKLPQALGTLSPATQSTTMGNSGCS